MIIPLTLSRIDTKNGSQPDPVEVSRGMFGALVGVPRLLKLLDKYQIKASWYIPAHTVETFPVECASIRDAGHEMLVFEPLIDHSEDH